MATTSNMNAFPPAAQAGGGRQRKAVLPTIILIICSAAFLIKALTSMVQESATWDETTYLGLGKYIQQTHRWDVHGSILHPPLSYFIHDIPLYFIPTDPGLWQYDQSRATNRDYLGLSNYLPGQSLLASPANDGDRLLTLSRLTMVLIAMLLGWFVYLWSYSLYGKWSASLAVILYSFSPNILANSCLITPDITVTTFTFITLYYFWRLLKNNRMSDAVLGGICFGLALLSKFTSVLLFPICLVLIVLWALKQKTLRARHCIIFGVIGMGVLFLGYGMNLKPYFEGISYQHDHAHEGGHPGFLMGHYSTTGWWYYFIVAFLIKTPIATIVFLTISLTLWVGKMWKGTWINEMFLLIPAATIFCFFSLNHLDIGLRYILPVYPFLFVFASKAAQTFLWNRRLTALSVAAAGWYVAASCYIHPHYLAYFNELVGGPDNGYKYLVDSNLDWGQDLKGLKSYMQKNGISRINLSYFGSDSAAQYGISYDWLPRLRADRPKPRKTRIRTQRLVCHKCYEHSRGLFF